MSRPRFLCDHDLNERIVDALLRAEPVIDLIRVRDVGMSASPDDEVLDYAANEGRLVISHDVNTMPAQAYRRMAERRPMAGLIMVRQALPVALLVGNLLLIWSASGGEEWQGQVLFLPL